MVTRFLTDKFFGYDVEEAKSLLKGWSNVGKLSCNEKIALEDCKRFASWLQEDWEAKRYWEESHYTMEYANHKGGALKTWLAMLEQCFERR